MRLARWTMLVCLVFGMAGTYGQTRLASPGTECPSGSSCAAPVGSSECSSCCDGKAACKGCCAAFGAGTPKASKCDDYCETDHPSIVAY